MVLPRKYFCSERLCGGYHDKRREIVHLWLSRWDRRNRNDHRSGARRISCSDITWLQGNNFGSRCDQYDHTSCYTFWLKESLPIEERRERQRHNIWHSLFIPGRIKAANPKPIIKLLFTMKLFFTMMMAFYIGTIALYLIDLFHFKEHELGVFFFVVGVFLAFNQAFLSKRFIKRFGEFKTLLIGLSLCVIGLFAITTTDNLYLFIAFYYAMNLGLSLCFPTFNALISVHADPQKRGEIMGISESINSFSMAVFPVIAATLYGLIDKNLYYLMVALPSTAIFLAFFSGKRLEK